MYKNLVKTSLFLLNLPPFLYLSSFLLFFSLPLYPAPLKAKPKTILVTGGAGFIGSHVNKDLCDAGYQTIILDNLYRGSREAVYKAIFIEGDFGNAHLLDQIFKDYLIDAVMHFGGLKDVGESTQEPIRYYSTNVGSTLVLLEAMLRHEVKIFVFSSSAAIFGQPLMENITEEHPCNPINPYGHSKLMIETILKDLDKAYGLRYSCLRYFNAAGGDPDGVIKNHQLKNSNLIPIILRSLEEPNGHVTVFGMDHKTFDGTCIRDYIHVKDISAAHITVMEKLFNGEHSQNYNLGNGKGFSVNEVIDTIEKVTGRKINVTASSRREGDPPKLIASSQKAKNELGWEPYFPSLETMVEHAWQAMP